MSATVTLGEHFKRLLDFNGREDRGSFWPYAALAFVIIMIAGMVISVPMTITAMQEVQQFAAQHPDQVTVTNEPGQYSIAGQGSRPELMPKQSIMFYFAVTFGLAIVLYAAAVVRRLRDRGKSGLWGLMPLPFILYSSIQMPKMFLAVEPTAQPDMALLLSIFVSNLLYIISLIWLIVLLAGRSETDTES